MKDGYYWVDLLDGEGPKIVQIINGTNGTLILFMGTDQDADVTDFENQHLMWVGPLAVPEEFNG